MPAPHTAAAAKPPSASERRRRELALLTRSDLRQMSAAWEVTVTIAVLRKRHAARAKRHAVSRADARRSLFNSPEQIGSNHGPFRAPNANSGHQRRRRSAIFFAPRARGILQ